MQFLPKVIGKHVIFTVLPAFQALLDAKYT